MTESTSFGRRKMAAAALAIATLACGSAALAQAPDSSSGGKELKEAMMKGMKEMDSMQTTGDTDRDFAMMMKMHHQAALDMARIEMKSGKDAKMKAMARKIDEAQRKEIRQFDDWLAKHK